MALEIRGFDRMCAIPLVFPRCRKVVLSTFETRSYEVLTPERRNESGPCYWNFNRGYRHFTVILEKIIQFQNQKSWKMN